MQGISKQSNLPSSVFIYFFCFSFLKTHLATLCVHHLTYFQQLISFLYFYFYSLIHIKDVTKRIVIFVKSSLNYIFDSFFLFFLFYNNPYSFFVVIINVSMMGNLYQENY